MITQTPMHPSAQRFLRLFEQSAPGATLVYHCGDLATDALLDPGLLATRDLFHGLRRMKVAYLSQKRIGLDCYEYRATKAALPAAAAQQP